MDDDGEMDIWDAMDDPNVVLQFENLRTQDDKIHDANTAAEKLFKKANKKAGKRRYEESASLYAEAVKYDPDNAEYKRKLEATRMLVDKFSWVEPDVLLECRPRGDIHWFPASAIEVDKRKSRVKVFYTGDPAVIGESDGDDTSDDESDDDEVNGHTNWPPTGKEWIQFDEQCLRPPRKDGTKRNMYARNSLREPTTRRSSIETGEGEDQCNVCDTCVIM